MKEVEVRIEEIKVGRVNLWVKGTTPLILNSMSEKVRRQLLNPNSKKTKAEKEQTAKHDPIEEYRGSMYRNGGDGSTRLIFPSPAFKAAMCDAALEIPGMKKTQIGRLIRVVGYSLDLYGAPKLIMSVVRSADMNHTPDIRTRAILMDWCCCVPIQFQMPTMNETIVSRLLSGAGMMIGVGDWRQGKGKGDFGCFEIVNKSEIDRIVQLGGRKVQDAAYEKPEFYDIESESLFKWNEEENTRKGR